MRLFIVAIFLLAFSFFAGAQVHHQSRAQFSIGAEAGLPVSRLAQSHTFVFGGYLQEDIPVINTLHFTIAAGYKKFTGKSNINHQLQNEPIIDYPDVDLLAAKGGLKYYLSPVFFVQAEAGIALVLNSPISSYDAGKAFIYSPQIGIELPVSGRSIIAIGLRYEATDNYAGSYAGHVGAFGLSVAYGV